MDLILVFELYFFDLVETFDYTSFMAFKLAPLASSRAFMSLSFSS